MNRRFQVDGFSREQWTQWCASFPGNNLYQAWDYAEAHSDGPCREVSRAVLFQDDAPVALAQFRIKRLPIAALGVAEANWGPLWHAGTEAIAEEQLGEFLEAIREEYGGRGLDVRLEIPGAVDGMQPDRVASILSAHGFQARPDQRAYRTVVLDLTQGLDKLRSNLNAKWRNSLNNAEKAGLQAECGSTLDHFDRFLQLYNEMWERKKFPTGVRMDAIRAFQASAPEGARLLVWIVQDQGSDIAAGVFWALGNTMHYFLGATSPRIRKNTNPGYLLQWLNVRKAIELGLRCYDLGGLTDLPDSGVDLFKVRMGGSRIVFPGWFEASASSWSSKVYAALEKGFRTARGLASRSRTVSLL
jgi:hypothetical protein